MKKIITKISLIEFNPAYYKNVSLLATILAGLLLLSACASGQKNIDVESKVFYPPLPNPPRIQFLNSFNKVSDIRKKESDLSSFILGEKKEVALINKPYGVALHDSVLFAVDTRGPGYVSFDLKNAKVDTFTGSGGGRMHKPINMVIDKKGNRFIADTGRDQILMFDKKNSFIRAYGVKGQFKPTDLLLTDDRMFVVDIAHHKIQVLSIETGNLLYEMGTPGAAVVEENSKAFELFHPTNIKLGNDGNLYISDTGNYRVMVITPDGKFVRSIGVAGNGPGQFARPKGIALDKNNNLYVVDAAFNNVQVFLPTGELVLVFGGPGNGPGNLDLPTDIEINYNDIQWFQQFADPGFKLEYVILIANQFGNHKINA